MSRNYNQGLPGVSSPNTSEVVLPQLFQLSFVKTNNRTSDGQLMIVEDDNPLSLFTDPAKLNYSVPGFAIFAAPLPKDVPYLYDIPRYVFLDQEQVNSFIPAGEPGTITGTEWKAAYIDRRKKANGGR